jgi:hypothetical protein
MGTIYAKDELIQRLNQFQIEFAQQSENKKVPCPYEVIEMLMDHYDKTRK